MRFIILIGLVLGVLSAESRYALLIGNSDYRYIDDLEDPTQDIKRLVPLIESKDKIQTPTFRDLDNFIIVFI